MEPLSDLLVWGFDKHNQDLVYMPTQYLFLYRWSIHLNNEFLYSKLFFYHPPPLVRRPDSIVLTLAWKKILLHSYCLDRFDCTNVYKEHLFYQNTLVY